MISPGTEFMDGLGVYLKEKIRQYKNEKTGKWKHLEFILSDATVPGEGEHKIMDHIRSIMANGLSTNVIYGLDSDLIFLCCQPIIPQTCTCYGRRSSLVPNLNVLRNQTWSLFIYR